MKKILSFVFAIGMATAAFAQQPVTVTITPAQGDVPEKAHIVPASYTVVYFEKEPSKSPKYYVVIRPIEGFDCSVFKLFSGSADALTEVSNVTFTRDDGVLTVKKSVAGITMMLSRSNDILVLQKDTIALTKLPRE